MPGSAEQNASRRERLVADDKAFLWHPFTAMKAWRAGEPLVIESAEGFELIDSRGRRYIDGFSSLWCNLHGHRVERIDAAIREQLTRVAHSTLLGLASPPSIELARRLVEIAPGSRRGEGIVPLRVAGVPPAPPLCAVDLPVHRDAAGQEPRRAGRPGRDAHAACLSKVFFSDSGATAVEVALKMAFQYWHNLGQPRSKFLALRDGYHGDTLGSVSVGGIDTFHALFRPLLFPATFVDSPNPYHHPAGDGAGEAVLRQMDQILSTAPGRYCAVILEPLIQAAAGMMTHPHGFLAGVRELTRRHEVLLIADEVATGLGRTGRLFACEHEAVVPDLLCLGKGLTGGYLPVAATLATQEIFDAFLDGDEEGKTFYHGHTFTGNALGCAAAVASVDLIFESGLLEKLPGKVRYVASRLAELADHPHVGDIRQCGMMVGVELVSDRAAKRPFDAARQIGSAVCRHALRRGLMIRPLGDVVVLMPAPAMDDATLERMMSAVVDSVDEYFRDHPAV